MHYFVNLYDSYLSFLLIIVLHYDYLHVGMFWRQIVIEFILDRNIKVSCIEEDKFKAILCIHILHNNFSVEYQYSLYCYWC